MTYEATYLLLCGIAIGASIRPAFRWLLVWAEGQGCDVGATQQRIDRARSFRPRSIPEPRRLWLVREPYDQGDGAA